MFVMRPVPEFGTGLLLWCSEGRFEMAGYELLCFEDDVGVAAGTFEPVHVGFAAEPGELSFGVVAVSLLGLSDGGFSAEFAAEDCDGFGVA